MRLNGRGYAAGRGTGSALVLREPLSFYGGVAAATGRIVAHSHPDLGRIITGRVLVIPGGRGSSSSSSVLAEAIRLGTGPAAIALARADPIMTVGCIVAAELYGLRVPLIVCPIAALIDDDELQVDCDDEGNATLTRCPSGTLTGADRIGSTM